MDVFLLFSAPTILQSDNGSEFTANIITELKQLWPDMKLVHGTPRHPQSQGSVERANGDIKDTLVAWLSDNNSKDWTTGIKFVQFHKNSGHHAGIKCSPSLPNELMSTIESEADLFAVFEDNAEAEDITTQSSCDTDSIDSRTTQITQHRHKALLLLKKNRPREWLKEVELISKQEPSVTMMPFLSLQLIEAEVIHETF